ncbi:MAG: hypothetical protein Q7S45_01460 [Candidatus Curtissbacteria bacterium]|nr:hypothetical protein [Candidatus Curtissbacteria bacterium]
MTELEKLKKEIEAIKARNARVERDKAWETSWTRKIAVAAATYAVVLIFFLIIKIDRLFLSAIVPTLGFILSTLSVDILKNWWLSKKSN